MTRPIQTLLLVDDSVPDRERYRRCLSTDAGCAYCLLEADSAIAGLELCRTQAIDAILLDYSLPDQNGIEFLQALHQQSNGDSPPVVMITGEGDERVAVQAIKLGAEDYLVKRDLTPELLQLAVRSAIENTHLRRQLRQSDDRFRVSIDNMLDCFGIYSAIRDESGQIIDFRFDYLNTAALVSNEMTPADMSKTLCELFPSHHHTGLFADYCRVVETGAPLRKENWIYSDAFGVQRLTRAYDIRASKLNDGLVISWRDVTDRTQVELRLRESEEQLQIGIQVAGVALARFDYTTNMVELSPAAAALYGLDELNVTRDRIHATFHPDEREEMARIIQQVIDPEGDGWFAREHRVVWQNGEVRWLNVRKQVFFDRSGVVARPSYAILAAIDITDRKHTEAALRENQQRFKAIIDNSKAAIFLKDLQGRYLLMNCECERLFHITNDWVCGKTDYDLFSQEIADALRANDRQVLEAGEAVRLEEEVPLEDGVHTYIAVKFPLFDSEGQPYAICGISTDISDRVRLQAERDQLLAEAEAAREEAEAANRSKDEFVAMVAHELRSPLNSIQGWAKLLQTRKFSESTLSKALDTIVRNTEVQVRLVEDLLDISRLVRGILTLDLAPVNLATVIDAALDVVRPQAQAKQIRIFTQLILPPHIAGDCNRLQQIVVNLLTNAIKFTPEGGRVEIQLSQVDAQVQLCIRDTGKGIMPEFLPQIFERFQQGQKNTGSKDGLGLGLAIVKNLVELHKGTITAESPGLGQGTTFTVRFPLLSTPAILPEQSLSMAVDEMSLAGIRILVVDDEPDQIDLITYVLAEAGAEVHSTTSAIAALERLSQIKPDLLISDLAMPERSGYELLQQVRLQPEGHIPAIVLTAYASTTHEERSLQAGFQCHLTKPVDPEDLIVAIVRVCVKS